MQDGRFRYVNPKFAEMFGFDVSEMLALRSVFDLIVEQERPIAVENVRLRLEGEVQEYVIALRDSEKTPARSWLRRTASRLN